MTPGEASTLYETEYRKGEDSYSRSVGHAVLPSGQLIAMWQGIEADELNTALFREVWEVWSRYLNDGEED